MNILVVGNRVPWPLHDGGALATYRLLESLSLAGNKITFFSFNTQKHFVTPETIASKLAFCEVITEPLDASVKPWAALKNLFTGGSYFLERYYNVEVSAKLTALIQERKFDLIQIEGLYSYPLLSREVYYWGELLTASIHSSEPFKTPIVYRAHNVEHEIWMRLAANDTNYFKKLYLKLQSLRLKKEELRLIKSADAVVGISQNDCDFFTKNGAKRVHLHLPSVKTSLKVEVKIQPDAIFHIGSMEWDANVQAVQWFLSKVWPLVKAAHPNLIFHVAGKGINDHAKMFFQTGVYNHGEVADASDFMRNHGIAVVPLLAGSGIRMKLIEALSLGIPCVATEIAVQGLPIKKEDGIIAIHNDANDFANALIDLIGNRKRAIEMAKLGHAYCLENHSAVKNNEELMRFYTDLTIAGKTP